MSKVLFSQNFDSSKKNCILILFNLKLFTLKNFVPYFFTQICCDNSKIWFHNYCDSKNYSLLIFFENQGDNVKHLRGNGGISENKFWTIFFWGGAELWHRRRSSSISTIYVLIMQYLKVVHLISGNLDVEGTFHCNVTRKTTKL